MDFVAIVSALLMVATLGSLVVGWVRRTNEVLSYHTLFMYGMVHFYLLSLAAMPIVGYPSQIYVPEGRGWIMLGLLLPPFMFLYVWANRVGRRWSAVERWTPKMDYPITNNGLLAGLVFAGLGTGATFLVTGGGAVKGGDYSDQLILQLRPGMGGVLAGMAAALLLTNLRNPFYWLIVIGTTIFGVLISTVTGSDRRFPLSALLAAAFVAYWLRLRHQSLVKVFTVVGSLLFIAFVFTLTYTNIRHSLGLADASIQRRGEQLSTLLTDYNPVFIQKNMEMLFFQDAPLISVFFIENYPNTYDLRPFNGPWSFIVMPIPRSIWPAKPEGMGEVAQRQLGAEANLAPGIVGSGWSEMMYVGVAYYAIFFGLFTGGADRLLRLRGHNPYFIVAMGSLLGNIFGLPRGGTFQFLSQWATVVFSAWFVLWLCHFFLKRFMAAGKPVYFGPPAPAVAADAYDEPLEEPALAHDPALAAQYARTSGPLPEAG